MNKQILITGTTGFIGRHIAQHFSGRKYDVSLLVRPGTKKKRMASLPDKAQIIYADLRDIKTLKQKLAEPHFDVIIHLGAIRNRPGATANDYLKANVHSTEQLALKALECSAKFIFFSSVGVFGSVPRDLPATKSTAKVADSLYHESKIKCEALINRYVLYGLNSAVVRPAITYGTGDLGFPYHLIRLIDKNRILLPAEAPDIHLANVDLLAMTVQKLVESDYKPGVIYNIADRNPVNLLELADFISQELRKKNFSRNLIISNSWFNLAGSITKILGMKGWHSRFQLFSQSWFYDVEASYNELNLKQTETIPGIRSTIEWYQKLKKARKI